jgi:UDP-N-acetylmuramoyl-L-alanyl-D-glutamate--2,6-diaminopimelate ligase
MMNIDLSRVLKWLDIDSNNLNIDVAGLCLDSRKIKPKEVFIALSGNDNHGIDFAYQVQRSGACAILAESVNKDMAKPKSRQQPLTIPVIEIENLSEKLGYLSSRYYGNPSSELNVIGITGTNGKTSSAWLLLQAWKQLDIAGAYIGTLGYGTLEQIYTLKNTTPSALELQKILAGFVDQGITHVAMEVSSHGLSLGRTNAVRFIGAGFTNISRDHLDFHQTMHDYAQAKKELFLNAELEFSVINFADNYGKQWLGELSMEKVSYAIDDDNADLTANYIKLVPQGIHFTINWNNNSNTIFTALLGQFNIENILLVTGILLKTGHNIKTISSIIPNFQPVPGRMNRVENNNNGPLVIVDYAHTPDALKQVLLALKQHNARKIWCVFGCGGNRDKGKRPQMGHIAETLADYVIITDDNPRFEDNQQISDDIIMGMNTKPILIHERKAAIEYVISKAHRNDLILIAGKGHETYQLINGQYLTFDDRVCAADILAQTSEKCA